MLLLRSGFAQTFCTLFAAAAAVGLVARLPMWFLLTYIIFGFETIAKSLNIPPEFCFLLKVAQKNWYLDLRNIETPTNQAVARALY